MPVLGAVVKDGVVGRRDVDALENAWARGVVALAEGPAGVLGAAHEKTAVLGCPSTACRTSRHSKDNYLIVAAVAGPSLSNVESLAPSH